MGRMYDCIVIGGGVIGMSLAYELSGRGASVCVLDRQAPGREASWAGAGIVAPAIDLPDGGPAERLHSLSCRLHPRWAELLREETGIDNGYRHCGAIHLSFDEGRGAELRASADSWRMGGLAVEEIDPDHLANLEPHLRPARQPQAAFHVPEEAQLRNPWHMKALSAACQRRRVHIRSHVEVRQLLLRRGRAEGVQLDDGDLKGDAVCVASGAWSKALLEQVGTSPHLRPIRGQIVLFSAKCPLLTRIVNVGHRYLVPRPDGRLLVGSTEEDVGFDKSTTAAAIEGLIHFARGLVPELGEATIEKTWAGLRPCTGDGLPYLGHVPAYENLYVAAGHYRSGITLSPGTAVVLSELIRGQEPSIDLVPFRLDR
jgi:glycine oxidase